MAKKQSKSTIESVCLDEGGQSQIPQTEIEPVPEADTADLSYIPAGLLSLVERIDSLVLDDQNVKDHGEADLPTHAASLREFGIQRAVVCHRLTRKILAGNGTVRAAGRNGWTHVPVIWFDGDLQKARAFALADNAVGTLAGWNEANLAALAAENDSLFTDDLLRQMTANLDAEINAIEEENAAAEQEANHSGTEVTEKVVKPEDIELSHRVVVTCANQEAQIKLLAEMESRGLSCRLSTIQIK